jgi:hypothetical protein
MQHSAPAPRRRPDGRGPAPSAPLGFVPSGWKRQVKAVDGGVDSLGYRLCLLETMRTGVRRRDLFASPSLRFADPRIGLLAGSAWEAARPSICRTLGLSTDGPTEVARMAERLDAAYQDTAANLPKNAAVQVDGGELGLSALDKLEEPPSLVALKAAVAARMPLVDLPELLLEMHARTGFADGFTHASEGGARAGGVATSLCAVLLAEACNTGFEPLIRRDNAALRRSRLSWVRQNYIRAETLTRTNAILVAAQNRIPLARAWGGGDVASADGLRFVVPVRTIHSGPNLRYYGQERGVTFYNLVSDQFTGLNGITVPGTLRDSLTLLSVVLEQQTELQPTEIMSDTGAYTDTIFGIFHLLGYQFSPRLADIGGARFWRVDGKADYGALDELAAQQGPPDQAGSRAGGVGSAEPAPWRGPRCSPRGCSPAVAARVRTYQHARPLRLHPARPDYPRRASTAPRSHHHGRRELKCSFGSVATGTPITPGEARAVPASAAHVGRPPCRT